MEHSEQTPADTANTAPPSHILIMVKALFSAAIFGTLGGWLGSWLGERGNNTHRQMAKPIMKWGMATFSALLAAYSSLKSSEHPKEETNNLRPNATNTTTADEVVTTKNSSVPLSAVETNAVEYNGKLAENRALSRA